MKFEEKINAIFDEVILQDTSLPMKSVIEIPFVEEHTATLLPLLFDSTKKYTDLSILDSELYSDADKIKLIEQILTLEDMNMLSSNNKVDYWKKNPIAINLLKSRVDHLIKSQKENTRLPEVYLKFSVVNQLDEAYSLIKNYFIERDFLERKNSYEGSFILELIRLSKYEDAVQYLEILINDYYDNKIEYLFIGTSLQQLCLCNNNTVRKKSIELLLKHLTLSKKGWDATEVEVAYYLNKEKVEELCIAKFEEFKHADLETKYNSYKGHFSFCRKYVSERIGKELWKDFLSKKEFIKTKEGSSFYENQFDILNAALNDRSLSLDEKINMLFEIEQDKHIFSYRSTQKKYINSIRKAFSGGFPDSEVLKKLNVSMEDYFMHAEPEYALMDYQRVLEPENIVNDLIAAKLLPEGSSVETLGDFSAFESFLMFNTYYQFFNSKIDKYLFQTGVVKRIFLPPLGNNNNYKQAFDLYFKPLLHQVGITDVDVIQKTEFKENDVRYSVVVTSATRNLLFRIVYSAKTTCTYTALAKAINLILIEKNIKQRFIESNTLDGMGTYQEFILFEPAKVKAFYDLYELSCWAIHYEDTFRKTSTLN